MWIYIYTCVEPYKYLVSERLPTVYTYIVHWVFININNGLIVLDGSFEAGILCYGYTNILIWYNTDKKKKIWEKFQS